MSKWTVAPICLAALVVLWLPSAPAAFAEELEEVPQPDVLDADDPMVSDDIGLTDQDLVGTRADDEDIVIAAQKVRTTIQEAPSIITVITKKQIAERGYRTVNEVLSTVPGFEGDRWEGNGWHKESFARGIPRDVLVLINGVNIVEPLRNYVNLDRKIPLEIVERIEITSGPGGVLWGSNALLGVINIVTKKPSSEDGKLIALAGFGDGPGERLQFKGVLGWDQKFSDDFGLFANVSFYSTEGPELIVDQQKILGAVPEPADDFVTFYYPESITASTGERSWFLNFAGRLELGPIAFDWMVPFEEDYRAVAFGGAAITENYLEPTKRSFATKATDAIQAYTLSYRDRFSDGDIGVNARLYSVFWDIEEDPFGIYNPSPVTYAAFGHTKDTRLKFQSVLQMRPGFAVDVDIQLTDDLTLVTGGEAFFDIAEKIEQRAYQVDFNGECQPPYSFVETDPHLKCQVDDRQVLDTQRFISGIFVNGDWKVHPRLALTAGARLQVSNQYDPAVLYSAGAVWNFYEKFNWKLFMSSGMRPPGIAAVSSQEVTSGITFQANPDLRVERSTSFETELNAKLLEDVGPLRDLYFRLNGAYTFMQDTIGRPAGVYQNSGEQDVWSAEAAVRLRFSAGHNLWANYSFVKVTEFTPDFPNGRDLENISRHLANFGGTLTLLDDLIELDVWGTFKGAMKDQNRPAIWDPNRPDYSRRCQDLAAGVYPEGSSLATLSQLCALPGMDSVIVVLPGTSVTEDISSLLLLNAGIRFKNIWRDLTATVYVHNLLDTRYYEPDFFLDPRVISRPQPKPGLSIFAKLSLGI